MKDIYAGTIMAKSFHPILCDLPAIIISWSVPSMAIICNATVTRLAIDAARPLDRILLLLLA